MANNSNGDGREECDDCSSSTSVVVQNNSNCPLLDDTDFFEESSSSSSVSLSSLVSQLTEDKSSMMTRLMKEKEDGDVLSSTAATVTTTTPTTSSSASFSFARLRLTYLAVNLVVMLADGLQGTHLYVLYEGYGYSVASLYALGFVAGAITTPFTGPLIDKFGRKKSAVLYCVLEMGINLLEQFPFLSGLLVSRIVGGITTNLLSSVFETWLDTEFRNYSDNAATNNRRRRRNGATAANECKYDDDGYSTAATASATSNAECSGADDEYYDDGAAKEEYELIMRDSVIVSNLASIASGYLAHALAEKHGPVGPFQGAVTCTGLALVAVSLLWTENYGVSASTSSATAPTPVDDGDDDDDDEGNNNNQPPMPSKSVRDYIVEAVKIFRSDPKILWLGIIQGFSAGSLQIFIFLWSPTLQQFASSSSSSANNASSSFFGWAVDGSGNPAYGLIFGAFMAAGVAGGLCAPRIRSLVSGLLFSTTQPVHIKAAAAQKKGVVTATTTVATVRPMALEFLAGVGYVFAAVLLLVPCFLSTASSSSFSIALASFLAYEFLVGVTTPCEGVIRSVYLPSDGRATMTMVPRMVVNLAVSLGVLLTKHVPPQSAFGAIAFLMGCAGIGQLSFLSSREWTTIRRRSIQRVSRSLRKSVAAKVLWNDDEKLKDE